MNNSSHNEHIKFQHTCILIEPIRKNYNDGQKSWDTLHFWGVFKFAQAKPLPLPHKRSWTRVSKIFPEFQICIGWGKGELQDNYEKNALFCESTQKV